jgi:hypothetical protein
MKKELTSTINIPVTDVTPAKKLLPEWNGIVAVEAFLDEQEALGIGKLLPHDSLNEFNRLNLLKAPLPVELIACSHEEASLVSGISYHPLMAALECAYAGHRPISLSPDMIWLLICQGVAHHINLNAEEVRSQFVAHEGRASVSVITSHIETGGVSLDSIDWEGSIETFSELVKVLTTDKVKTFIANFSTTGQVERIASKIVLLGALKQYFSYSLVEFICGIPRVELEGTVADWQQIIERLEGFSGLGLDWWLTPLKSVLEKFPAAFRGEISPVFWRSIYRKYQPGDPCSPESTIGWITMFFPYFVDHNEEPTVPNPWLTGEKDLDKMLDPPDPAAESASEISAEGVSSIPDRDDDLPSREIADKPRYIGESFHGVYEKWLPSGMTTAPFILHFNNLSGETIQSENLEFLGGFLGVSQDRKTFCLRPEIGWGVRKTGQPLYN